MNTGKEADKTTVKPLRTVLDRYEEKGMHVLSACFPFTGVGPWGAGGGGRVWEGLAGECGGEGVRLLVRYMYSSLCISSVDKVYVQVRTT